MKKNNFLAALITTTIALFSPISSMELAKKTPQQPEPDNICFLSSVYTAKSEYLFQKKTLNTAIEAKKNIPLKYWRYYKHALENYNKTIPSVQKKLKATIALKIEKTDNTIRRKEEQLIHRDAVYKKKEIITNKIKQNQKVSLENLIEYQLALKKYIAILPNQQMKDAPLITFHMVAEKIDDLAGKLCEDIKHNANKHSALELTTNYMTLSTLQAYARAVGSQRHCDLMTTLQEFINRKLVRKQELCAISSIQIQTPPFNSDSTAEDDYLSDKKLDDQTS